MPGHNNGRNIGRIAIYMRESSGKSFSGCEAELFCTIAPATTMLVVSLYLRSSSLRSHTHTHTHIPRVTKRQFRSFHPACADFSRLSFCRLHRMSGGICYGFAVCPDTRTNGLSEVMCALPFQFTRPPQRRSYIIGTYI